MGEAGPGIVQRAKKRVNRFLLDNKHSQCVLIFLFVVGLSAIFLLSTIGYLRDKNVMEADIMQSEINALKDLVDNEGREKAELLATHLSLSFNLRENQALQKQNEEIIRIQSASIKDLELGAATFENRLLQLEKTILLSKDVKPQTKIPTKGMPEPIQTLADDLFGTRGLGTTQPVRDQPVEPVNNQNKEPLTSNQPTQTQQQPKTPSQSIGTEDTQKQQAVKGAMRHAWDSYKKFAWGHDELMPISRSSKNWLDLGMTIVDALDTLWIMDMKDEFQLARDWVAEKLNFEKNMNISFFETVIRELGGLLSAYEFSRDKVFLDKAEILANKLLKAFDTPYGIPYASVNLMTGYGASPGWTGGSSILSEIGTVQLEFLYLAYHTNNPKYAIAPMKVFKHLDSLDKDQGLYPVYVSTTTGQLVPSRITLGALGDSFYEYMVKLWVLTNKQADGYRRMWEESSRGIMNKLVQTSISGYRYMAQTTDYGSNIEYKMEHLACFSGGLFALGAVNNATEDTAEHLKLGADLTESCYQSYHRTATHIGPEAFEFSPRAEFTVQRNAKYYILRPEVVESYFVLWRTTHEQKYRDYAWEAFQAIEEHCRGENGYSGLHDVDRVPAPKDDTQQSFFLAETLKYLYLIFSDDSVIPLDKYVFNTEAHPLGIITEDIYNLPQELLFTLLLN